MYFLHTSVAAGLTAVRHAAYTSSRTVLCSEALFEGVRRQERLQEALQGAQHAGCPVASAARGLRRLIFFKYEYLFFAFPRAKKTVFGCFLLPIWGVTVR